MSDCSCAPEIPRIFKIEGGMMESAMPYWLAELLLGCIGKDRYCIGVKDLWMIDGGGSVGCAEEVNYGWRHLKYCKTAYNRLLEVCE